MDIKKLKRCERLIIGELKASENFIVLGDPTGFIKTWAGHYGIEVLSMEIRSMEDIQGNQVIVTDRTTPYFYDSYWWMDLAEKHPDKKYIMLFYVENADIRTINALKSFLEEDNNLFYGIIFRDPNKEVNSTINSLCFGPIRWDEDSE